MPCNGFYFSYCFLCLHSWFCCGPSVMAFVARRTERNESVVFMVSLCSWSKCCLRRLARIFRSARGRFLSLVQHPAASTFFRIGPSWEHRRGTSVRTGGRDRSAPNCCPCRQ